MLPTDVLFLSPAKTVGLDRFGEPTQKFRTNISLPALQILGSLEQAGFSCEFVDIASDGYEHREVAQNLCRFGMSLEEACDAIRDIGPKLVLISSMFSTEQWCVDELVDVIRERFTDLPIVLGGIHATVRPEWHFRENKPDAIVLGSDAETIVRVACAYLRHGEWLDKIEGVVYKTASGDMRRTPPAAQSMLTIDTTAINEVLYRQNGSIRYLDRETRKSPVYLASQVADARSFALYGSRGCPFGCAYCATTPRDGPRIQHVGHLRLLEVIEEAYKHGVTVFYNQADTFGIHPEDRRFLSSIADMIESRKLDLTLNNPNAFFVRALIPAALNFEIDVELIALLNRARFNVVTLAVETTVQRFNKKIDWSKIRWERLKELCAELKRRGMRVDTYWIYGFPGQTLDEVRQDERAAMELSKLVDSVSWHALSLFPGTEYYDFAIRTGLLSEEAYRESIRVGHGFFNPLEGLNLSEVPTDVLLGMAGQFEPAWAQG